MKLTKAQKRELIGLVGTGFTEHRTAFGRSQSNGPLWSLCELGLAEFGWGPNGSFLTTQGFLPTDAGRAALSDEVTR